ncbi:MAG: glycosyltransferase [Ferruginibacter sp.]
MEKTDLTLNTDPEISIVIPVKNGGPWLDDCLKAIINQTLFSQTEIIVVDSGSTDESLTIIKNYPVCLYTIPPHEYDHGLTRNLGVGFCKGKYVVMTVQDAKATDDLWLQKMLDGFSLTEKVAGVCGQQIVPHDKDKNPVDWFRPTTEAVTEVYGFSRNTYQNLSPEKKKAACSWDNVTAMYQREVLERFPFQKTSYGEDAVWANDVLKAGYTLVYNTAARVYHYHYEDWGFMFRRTLTVMYFRYKQFGYLYQKPKQSFRSFLSMVKQIVTTKDLTIKEKWHWIRYNAQRFNAIKKAHEVFFIALKSGEKTLDEVHNNYCGKSPVPLTPKMQANAINSLDETPNIVN